MPIVVVMLDRTSAYKMEATRAHGAEVVLCGDDAAARQPTVNRIAAERGMTAIDTWEERPDSRRGTAPSASRSSSSAPTWSRCWCR